ncbi:hypothetical protein NMG60_11026661 [Bertholletia excelsa]
MESFTSLVNVQKDKNKALPKFGDWDVNNPASAAGFTVVFTKAREEKKATGTAAMTASAGRPKNNPATRNNPPPRQDQSYYQDAPMVPYLKKVETVLFPMLLCFLFHIEPSYFAHDFVGAQEVLLLLRPGCCDSCTSSVRGGSSSPFCFSGFRLSLLVRIYMM